MEKINSLSQIQLISIARELDVLKNIERAFSDTIEYNVKVSKRTYLTKQTYRNALIMAIKNELQ